MTDSPGAPARSAAKKPGLRDRMRAAVRDEVTAVALRLFAEQGFDHTTVEQIAAEAGLSRASLFRHFGTKEDIVLGNLEERGRQVADALAARPDDEPAWDCLRRAFDVMELANTEAPQPALNYLRMLRETPSLRARYWEKQLTWQTLLTPEIARRQGVSPDDPADPSPGALVAAALACLDAAVTAWVAADGAIPLGDLLDRTMGALTQR